MRMNRIDKKFAELRARKKKAFIAFITAGDPSLAVTRALVMAFEKAGVDIVELGVPFSDPLADGPTIQAASQRALRNKVTARAIVNTVSAIRRHSQIPIALMTYYNPVLRFGEKRFVEQARRAGVDGLIIPDLPPAEASTLIRAARRHDAPGASWGPAASSIACSARRRPCSGSHPGGLRGTRGAAPSG